MADNDLVPVLLLSAAGYLAWKYWPQIQSSIAPKAVTTPLPSRSSSWVDPPIQYAPPVQTGQITGTKKPSNITFQSLGMPAMQGSIFTNPAWRPQLQADMTAPAALPVNRPNDQVVSTLPGEWTAGRPDLERSDPNAKPNFDAAWWAEWERTSHCRAITGAPILPPPPGC